ncbi:MAG: PspC domain-containing protein, partial [Actinomycetota bacterium]
MTTQTTTSSTVPTAPAPAPRRLYRSNDRLLGGVAAGLADYAKVDVAVARLAFVAVAFSAVWGPLLSNIACNIIPPPPGPMPPAPMAPP